MGKLVTDKEYEIHFYEVDYKGRALFTSLMNYFGDISSKQSEDRNMGIDYLKKVNMAWVLYKWNVKIHRYPIYREKIIARTVPYSFRKFYAYRKFYILDIEGNVLVEADSLWFLIDIETRKPVRVQEEMYTGYCLSKDDNEVIDIPRITAPNESDFCKTFDVRYSDIDTNGHVNNSKYISWILEAVPLNIVTQYSLSNLIITYEKETTYGEVIDSCVEVREVDGKAVCKHKILDKEGSELTVAETTWTR
ncbi:MAG: acyl-ACP thioesterase [Clostridium lundense]|nr:acyl-ACP thioesterase [Clostridium lundense]